MHEKKHVEDFDWKSYDSHLSDSILFDDKNIMKHIYSTKDGPFIRDGKLIRREIGINDLIWTSIDPLLGTASDEAIAKFFGIPDYYVMQRRECFNIPELFDIPQYILWRLVSEGTNEEIRELFTYNLNEIFSDEYLDKIREKVKANTMAFTIDAPDNDSQETPFVLEPGKDYTF